MLKKIIPALTLVLTLALMAAAPALQAQIFADEEEAKKAFTAEQPLTQADIDTFIKIAPQVFADDNPAAASKIFKAAGLTDSRGAYIMTKVSLSMMQFEADEDSTGIINSVPEPMRPTPTEMALVKKNQEALNKTIATE